MKKYLVSSLYLVVFLLMSTGSAFAVDGGSTLPCAVPEPGMLALLSSGMAGLGLFNFIKRKKGANRNENS
jgi:hypothetical protein